MKKYKLIIREIDKRVFEAIQNGEKTIETRAATDKYRQIKKGDVLVFVCGNQTLKKKVKEVAYYESIEDLVKNVDFRKVMPFVSSIEEMREVYYSFPNYKEKIEKFGLAAFVLE